MYDYLTGIYNITPTPFSPDGTLDEASLRRLTEFTRGTKVNGMTAFRCRPDSQSRADQQCQGKAGADEQ